MRGFGSAGKRRIACRQCVMRRNARIGAGSAALAAGAAR
jgi:hypothetical protein